MASRINAAFIHSLPHCSGNFFVFPGLNGYLFGREYFEVVALRRPDRVATPAVRQRFAGQVFLGGVAIAIALMAP